MRSANPACRQRRRPKPGSAPRPRLDLDAVTPDAQRKALKPWIEVALPHPDVIANRFKEAEFAADLFAVDAGHASDGYATPTKFFGITFLTEGLKRVLIVRAAAAGGHRRRSGDRASDRVRRRQDAHDARRSTISRSTARRRRSAQLGRRRAAFRQGRHRQARRSRSSPCSSARPRAPTSSPEAQERAASPHAVGLHRLAACRRSRA